MPLFRRKMRKRSSSRSPARYWPSMTSNFSMSRRAAGSISRVSTRQFCQKPTGVINFRSGEARANPELALETRQIGANPTPLREGSRSAAQELGHPERQVQRLAGVEAGVAGGGVADVELVLEDRLGPAQALGDVIA